MLWVLKRTVSDDSFEHPKHMFKLMDKEINAILGAQTILIWTYVVVIFLSNSFYVCFGWVLKKNHLI